ncbi:hypothetical protein CGRA01v4_00092 [Colletotrichum graminicola]|nr:hypothetical protein CGRA01v4_00092 [Colletotrichum graminicola]
MTPLLSLDTLRSHPGNPCIHPHLSVTLA